MNLFKGILKNKSIDKAAKMTGDLIIADVDVVCISDIQFPIFKTVFSKYLADNNIDKFTFKNKIVLVTDHFYPPATIDQARRINDMKKFAKKYNISDLLISEGIKHQSMVEKGLVKPYDIIVATDSHTNTLGACGAFAVSLGPTEAAAAALFGKAWFKIPEVIEIKLIGKPPKNVYAKDIALALLGKYGSKYAIYKALLFTGPPVLDLGMEERMTICNMSTELGAKACIFPPDQVTEEYYKKMHTIYLKNYNMDNRNNGVESFIEVNLSDLEPLIALPDNPENVTRVKECKGIKITQGFIGSCAGGMVNDIKIATQILEGKKIHPNVELYITPATRGVLRYIRQHGYVDILEDAGATVTTPGCGSCPGIHSGVMGPEDVRISTQNRNFVGRSGDKNSKIYLANAAVVALSVLKGEITNP